MKQNIYTAITTQLFKWVVAALVLFIPVSFAFAAPCDLKPSPPAFIRHDLTASAATSVSYCELCGYGYVTVIVSNPYVGTGADATDMINMTVIEDLRSSGLTYEPTAPNPVRYSVNGGALQVGGAPAISGANGSILTWTSAQIPPLNLLAPQVNINNFSTIAITFSVKRSAALSQEALITANRQIQASLNYSTSPACVVSSTVSTGLDTLPLREPIPTLIKRGRNVDANQGSGSYTTTVYGNINDDVIWRIQIRNTGLAAMQDVRLDDLMLNGNFNIHYACSTEGTATTAANNLNSIVTGGSPPAPPAGCVAANNTVSDFVVNNPFGTPGNDSPDLVDAPASGSTYIYLVGKVSSSCSASRTNTASDLQWGCTGEGLAGGIATTSTGATPASSTATLSTLVGAGAPGLTVLRQLRGTNFAQPVGSKGTMRITITNNTGGTIKNIKLRDVLPLEYVMDSTFTPTVAVTGGYGNYSGRTNTITWTNPVAGTVPLTSVNPADPLGNTQPEFTLTSTTGPLPIYPDQVNMLRRGETLTINFRVVLIKSSNYDKVANLDVRPEVVADGTDPGNQTVTLSNSLYLTYEDFCNPGVTKNAPTYPYVDTFTAFPEDLDIDINGTVFILTNDPLQPLTLPVVLTNNGGHDASNYHVFVSFGATMNVQSAPAGCSVIAHPGSPSQPAPWKAWVLPAPIPATATVYHCDSAAAGGFLPAALAPAGTRTLNFQVIKTADPVRIAIDDLSFRADVVGEITLTGYPAAPATPVPIPLWFPTPTARADGQTDRANNYSLDAIRARVIGFNLAKSLVGNCTENNPPPASPDNLVQIGEECTFHIDSGGWFGFQTPGFTYIAVQNITVTDELPNGQGYISSTDPALTSTSQVKVFSLTAQTSPPLNPVDEGWIDWTFNPVGDQANRILQKDEWFRINVTNRILNDPLNLSGAPNLHAAQSRNVLNSTFEAVFNNASTGLDEIFLLGPATIGYPQAVARRVDLTVTEPDITVVKTVCNETLYGVGAACSNFVALANNGDTYDNYIYRIAVTNGATASGVARAPAYDVVVTDVLDANDLAYVVPFAADGLDNDADTQSDGADAGGEGSISDNIVKNATPAMLTFSYTNSSALQKINAGTTVNLYYRVDPDQDLQAGQTLVNSVTAAYDSLSGASGAQTVVASASGTAGGARNYTSAAASATVQMVTPSTQPKRIVALSQPNHTVIASMPVAQPVSVGEEIRYELHTLLPIANLRNFVITDNLPVGVRCAQAPAVNLGAAPYSSAGFVPGGIITPTCTDTLVRWDFGDQALTNGSGFSLYDFGIEFIGRVENTASTNNGGLIRNGGAFTVANAQYTNSSNTVVTLPYANVDIQVQEPVIALSKTFTPVTGDAGDQVLVTVSATNTGSATAYNLRVLDDLSLATHLSYFGNVSGTDPPDVVDVATLGASRPIFSWNTGNADYAIAPTETRTFTYLVRVEIGAQPLEVLSNVTLNSMQAKWDSLPGQTTALNTTGLIGADGSATGLRNGALPNAASTLNDYETSTSATLSVAAVTMSKTDLSPAVVPAIGAYKNFQIDINLPEGTTQNVLLTDNLLVGSLSYLLSNNATYDITYTFSGISTINGAAPDETAFTAFPADGTTTSAVWNIGTVVTASENDPTASAISPRIRINYSARIDNAAATDAGDTLRNSAVVTYRNGATGLSASTAASSPAQVTVVEPLLTLGKSVVNVTTGVAPNAGDVLRYTLTLTAAGAAANSTAFDISIADNLSLGLLYQGSPTVDGAGNTIGAPVVVSGDGITTPQVLRWSLADANADIDVLAGATVTVTYDVVVLNSALAGQALTNSAVAQWTSLDGIDTFERTGTAAPAYNDYYTTAATTTLTTPNNTAFAKARISDTYGAGDSNVRIGDTVDYELRLTLNEGTTSSVVIGDALPRGLRFDSIVSVNGNTVAPFDSVAAFTHATIVAPTLGGDPVTGPSTLTWTIGNIVNAGDNNTANNDFVIVYRATVLPDAGIAHVATSTLSNTATMTYTSATGSASLSSTATVTVLQPIMTALSKTTNPSIPSGSYYDTSNPIQFHLQACNTNGLAPAYSVVFSDTLAPQFDETKITGLTVTINGVATIPADYTYVPPAGLGGTFTLTLNKGIDPGLCAEVDYSVDFHNPIGGPLAWNNAVSLSEYWSLPLAAGQQYAPLGPVLFALNNAAVIVTPPTKTLPIATAEVTIGSEFTYRFSIPGPPQNLYDVKVNDLLDSNLVFVSALRGVSTLTNSGTPNSLILNAGDIASGTPVDIDITVRVANSAAPYAGAPSGPVIGENTATYTYALTNAVGEVQVLGGTDMTSGATPTIVEPLVGLVKSVANITNPGVAPKGGDVLRYTLAMTASTGVNYSNAYDISINDTLSLGLLYSGNPLIGGVAMAAPTTNGANGVSAAQVLNWSLADDITEGSTVNVTYDVLVLNSVLANQTLSNSAVVQWTSLDGPNPDERNGSNSLAYNDYFTAAATTTLTTLDPTILTKTRLTDTYGAGDTNVRIGEVVDFQLSVVLPEGSTSSIVLTDILPQGLQFESIVSVNGDSSAPFDNVAPFTHTSVAAPAISGDPLTGSSTATWTIGNIVNAGDNNAANDNFVIVYRARVLNGALAQGAGVAQTLTNNATLNYITATGAATRTSAASLNLQQPMLTVSKTSAPVAGSIIAPGATVTYTVDIVNSGTAPAYDVNLRDVLPVGVRTAGITMVSTTLAGVGVANVTPVYSAVTGIATWNFDTGVANAYTIPAGGTLRLVYSVQSDAGLSAGMTMSNQAQVQDYCTFDNNAVPVNGSVSGVRQCYGTSNTATSTLVTAAPNPLGKVNTQATAAIGDQFKYRITVPATVQATALYDVRILDNLATSAADISYVSLTQVSGPAWTPVVTEAPLKNLVIAGSGAGLDIPAGQQAVFDITVVLNDSVTNTSGLTFQNTASYTYDQIDGDTATQSAGGAGVTANMTIVGPDSVTLQKSGPATMRIGVPATFTLNVQNTGTSPAWDMTIADILPNPAPGGMCDVVPTAITARMYLADGVTAVGAALVAGTDYSISTTNFATAATTCTLTLTMTSAAAAIAPTNRLIVSYQASLDSDNFSGVTLTNIAGATQWFSGDTAANVATGQIHTYTATITDGTPATLDHQDARPILTESPILEFRKSVINVTTGQNPGANASPGDLLRYTITINNVSTLAISNFTLTDELDRLNATASFQPGSLALVAIPAGASATFTDASGGSKGTGLVDIRNLSIDAVGGANANLTVVFEARLAPVITSGTAVLNQAQLPTITNPPLNSDDPNVNGPDVAATIGDEDPTRTVIASAPVWQVRKVSLDITGDPLVLLAGERLRYTITVKNIGNENASNVSLRDLLPANTSYVAGSTQLNGIAVADIAGVSALQTGMLINAPEDVTAGVMRADAGVTLTNVATVTFEVQVNSNVLNGAIISNQGFVNGSGLGSGVFAEKPSDDPATTTADDPTLNIVGNFPLLVVQKTVAIQLDNNANGIVDPLDNLRYTITINNLASIPATGVMLTDLVPANTTYVADSVTLNGAPLGQPDGGVSPLVTGAGVESPASASSTIDAHQSAVITFDVQVDAAVPTGTVISNQGNVTSTELPNEPTDADGNNSNGYQPTTIIVGTAQQITITKQVTVVGGGAALAGGQLEYLVRVTNSGTVAATNVVISDDLSLPPLATQVSYVAGSATLNGLSAGVTAVASVITADYAAAYGVLAPGAIAQLRFRVAIAGGLAMGTTITNTGQVAWNAAPVLTATASAAIDVGGVPGSANLNGQVWHDTNFNNLPDTGELNLAGWSVGIYRGNTLLGTTTTDAGGIYGVSGLTPTAAIADQYSVRFSAPGAVATTAKLGRSDSVFTSGMQEIAGISALSGSNLQNLNLPADPDGVVYNSILRTPVSGVMLTMVRTGSNIPLQPLCFDDPAQQGQVTLASGYYKFDLTYGDPSCPSGVDYLIRISSPLTYMPGQSLIIPPLADGATAAFSVPSCPAGVSDAIPATATYCESQPSEFAPGLGITANSTGTNYYMNLALNNTVIPGSSQIFNNHIAVDPRLDNAVTITKIASLQNVTKGQMVPYTITVNNTMSVTLTNLSIVDTFPPGFKYVAGSGRLDGQPVEPASTTRQLSWSNLQLATNTKRVIQLMLIAGSGVKEGKYINRAQVFNTITGGAASPEASATVRVIPDPTLDCSDVIGKVFDDVNLNGYQDDGEKGLPGVRVVTARGLLITADKFGRFHIACAVVPDPDRGSNFILKVDDRTLPSGYRLTTENPRVQRATRGKMLKFNFGAAIHKVVKLDMSDGVFEPGTTEMRVQWKQRTQLLLGELKKAASVLRLSYLAETEDESLVNARLKIVKAEIAQMWKKQKGQYDLTIETEVFWRTGSPPEKSDIKQ